MFEFFFKYSRTVFARGDFVFLARWPLWVLAAAIAVACLLLGLVIWLRRGRMFGLRLLVIWMLQSGLAALLLTMLWQPTISVATLKPQQNIVAVVVDDSRSMSISEDGQTRIERARSTLNGGLVAGLAKKFQVRLYRFGAVLERVEKIEQLTGAAQATHISDALRQVAVEASSLPIGAMVLVSDGADNSGGIDRETIAEIRRYRIPVHTVGVGRERPARDVEITDAVVPARTLADSRVSAQVTLRQYGYQNRAARLTISEGGKKLASQEVTLRGDGQPQTESILFNAGLAGAKTIEIAVEQFDGEENTRNNAVMRLINVEALKPRVLYFEG